MVEEEEEAMEHEEGGDPVRADTASVSEREHSSNVRVLCSLWNENSFAIVGNKGQRYVRLLIFEDDYAD